MLCFALITGPGTLFVYGNNVLFVIRAAIALCKRKPKEAAEPASTAAPATTSEGGADWSRDSAAAAAQDEAGAAMEGKGSRQGPGSV